MAKGPEVRDTLAAITADHLVGLPGLSKAARDALIAEQPKTALAALRIQGVGRKTTHELLRLGLITDPEGVQHRGRTLEEMGLEPPAS